MVINGIKISESLIASLLSASKLYEEGYVDSSHGEDIARILKAVANDYSFELTLYENYN